MDMSNSALRSEPGNEARQEIVRAAAKVFMEFGFASSTIDAVANRLGATKSQIYHYFSSKAALFFEVQRSAMERLTREVEPLARSPGSPADRLRAVAFRHTMVILEDLPIQKISLQGLERQLLEAAVGRHTRKFRNAIRLRDEFEQLFAEVIDEGVRAGLFVDLSTTARNQTVLRCPQLAHRLVLTSSPADEGRPRRTCGHAVRLRDAGHQ